MDDLQQLESFTTQVRTFNKAADELANQFRALSIQRDLIMESGKELSLPFNKTERMLARIRVDVLMPLPALGSGQQEAASQEPAQQDGEADPAAGDEQQGKAA